ncbi:adenylate/guanylate cyclase domain-containing protein [Coraliomargarita sp. SDUM461004]|uniref:Adenylate/guanylate cyclase domain-containing protein n=1 Tax=Thalassobacterium sedimentorum TaxID=3041258 RepID=A0ABU1AFI1_9BACT|nr:adenylate/guanylate cyclase domain-containing protein [Coraliomargarita sp. SDUM461004]MDQ8193571.1 adenylate/guanylate cyclase domain-containing protein [Coraliomargarita sp. SDUM461004]
MNNFKQLLVSLGLILLSLLIWLLVMLSGFLDGVEQETLRWRYLARGELSSQAPIVYVDLDAETVSYMGDRPWDRREFGVLLEALLGPGAARVVSVDIILSKFGAGALLDMNRARQGDIFLGQAVETHADRVVLAAAYTGVKSATTDEFALLPLLREGRYDAETAPFPEAPTFPIIKFEVGRLGLANVDESLSEGVVPYFVPGFVELSGPRYSYHLIDGAMRHKEHFMNEPYAHVVDDYVVLTDLDGFVTDKLPMQHEMTLFTLGLETFLAAYGLDENAVQISSDSLTIMREGAVFREIPLVQRQSIEVNWFEGWNRSIENERISMQAVLRQADALADASSAGDQARVAELEAWFERFRGQVVFVGPVDPQLKDISLTPFNREPVPKVGLHANLYRTIEDQAYVTRADLGTSVAIVCLLTMMISLLALRGGASRMFAILLMITYVTVTFVAFALFHCILPLIAPVGSALSAAVVVVLRKLGSEEWQRRRIKTLFGAYVAPKLVDEMVESKQDPKLGGVEAQITALFSDVEGFSSLSEELSPDQLVSLMNEYLGAMTNVFQERSGTLDKYIGDAIVTMFGMPVPVSDHASRACLAAVNMQLCHASLRKKWAESGQWPESVLNMRTRIGLNSGPAVIGNMGSEMRFNYTMMGDSVNLAARCESGAKCYGVYTMATEHTLSSALEEGAELNYRKLDRVVVKGRRQPVEVYELWDPSMSRETTEPCKLAYEAALELYFAAKWEAALAGFEAAQKHEPSQAFAPTTPSLLLQARCRELLESGDPSNWDGAYIMTSK